VQVHTEEEKGTVCGYTMMSKTAGGCGGSEVLRAPSLHPRSYTTSVGPTPAIASISSHIFWGVAEMGPR
jgi:hypothetical protein